MFTGQGSQYSEMGTELINKFDWVRERYEQSSDILGYNVLKIQEETEVIVKSKFITPTRHIIY